MAPSVAPSTAPVESETATVGQKEDAPPQALDGPGAEPTEAVTDDGRADEESTQASEAPATEASAETEADSTATATTSEASSNASDSDGWMKLDSGAAQLEEKQANPKPYFRTMLLIEGSARYGFVTIAPPGTTLEDEAPGAFESRVGNFGGQVTLGVMPGGNAFTMAGRLRGGSYVSADFTRGNVAADMLFGVNFGRNARGNEFTYILGGFGVEFLPGDNQDILTLSLGAATLVKGVSFGGGIFLGANDEIAIGTFGMQIGWGQLF